MARKKKKQDQGRERAVGELRKREKAEGAKPAVVGDPQRKKAVQEFEKRKTGESVQPRNISEGERMARAVDETAQGQRQAQIVDREKFLFPTDLAGRFERETGNQVLTDTVPLGATGLFGGTSELGAKTLPEGVSFVKKIIDSKNKGVIIKTAINEFQSITTQRAFIGKASKGADAVEKLFKAVPKTAKTASRYASNTKTARLTKRGLFGVGFALVAIDKLLDAFGSYPWAAHNTREARDSLTFGMRKALNDGNIEEYDKLRAEFTEVDNPEAWEKWLRKIPYVNVIKSSVQGMDAAREVVKSMDTEADNKRVEGMEQGREDERQRVHDETFRAAHS